MSEQTVSSIDDPRLDPFRDLKRTNRTRHENHFIAEGIRVVQRLLSSDFAVRSIVIDQAHRERFPEDLGERTDLFVLPTELASSLVGFRFHAGVLACGERPVVEQFDHWMSKLGDHRTLVVCPRITDPENIGTLIRLCAGFGIDGLIVGTQSTDPFSRRSIRVSMGHAFSLPIYQSDNLLHDLTSLRNHYGYQRIAVELTDDAVPLQQIQRSKRSLLMFGNETDGLANEYLAVADISTLIPMHGQVDSLNVAISAAIVMYHLSCCEERQA